MKITITPTGLTTAFLLADDTIGVISGSSWPNGAGGTYKEGLNPDQSRSVQVQELFRSAYPAVIPRFNWQNTLSFTVERTFASYDMCLNFCMNHAFIVPANGEVMQQNSGLGSLVLYSPGASIKKAHCEEFGGVYCRWKYDIILANPWQTTP